MCSHLGCVPHAPEMGTNSTSNRMSKPVPTGQLFAPRPRLLLERDPCPPVQQVSAGFQPANPVCMPGLLFCVAVRLLANYWRAQQTGQLDRRVQC